MSGVNILIVDDEAIIAYDIRQSLINLGYNNIELAHSANDAIGKTFSMKPDLILMDINLNDNIDGVDVTLIIHQTLDTPVIFITGNTDNDTLDRIEQTQYSGILIKPITIQDLNDNIENIFHHNKQLDNIKSEKESSSMEDDSLLFPAIKKMCIST